jgi:hypothetical protein
MTSEPGKQGDPSKGSEQRASAANLALSAIDIEQGSTLDISGLSPDEVKREFDIFRDVTNNVNNTLRFQIQLSVGLLAACVTVLNIVPPQSHQEMLNDLDRWVFIPVLISMFIGYRGLEHHWYSNTRHQRLPDIKGLYLMVKYKHKMIRWTLALQAFSLLVMMVFVLLEYR